MNLSQSNLNAIADLYGIYNNTVKPLVANIEAYYQQFPLPILNEIRAFTDHIGRCFYLHDPDKIDENIKKARSHVKRIVFDCFKYSNVHRFS